MFEQMKLMILPIPNCTLDLRSQIVESRNFPDVSEGKRMI